MHLTDRLTRMLLGAMTLGAVLVPATVAAAEPPGPGDLTTPTTDPCGPDGCLPPEPEPEPECPPFVATCDDLTSNPCDPVEEDCSPDPEPCPQDADADCPDPNPAPEPEPEVGPDPEPVDPSVPADPNFTG
ncbi:MAG TPA: hypothetical protein VK611_05950 [Acidimicrobiales bacterium]|nr:hypothetical protein [Acidimicrobiales bacterium]